MKQSLLTWNLATLSSRSELRTSLIPAPGTLSRTRSQTHIQKSPQKKVADENKGQAGPKKSISTRLILVSFLFPINTVDSFSV